MFRSLNLMKSILPRSWINSMMERQLNQRFDHAMYGLKPQHRVDGQVGENGQFSAP